MPQRALYEQRPWLLASLAIAVAYAVLRDGDTPEPFQLALKGAAIALLAMYALLRHRGGGSRSIAAILAVAAIGSMAIDMFFEVGVALLVVAFAMGAVLFLRHRRGSLSASQVAAAIALLVLTPVIAWLESGSLAATIYAVALGAMAAAAWTSSFPRYRVGMGAVLLVFATLVGLAPLATIKAKETANLFVWPSFYFGLFLICVGVIATMRARQEAG